MSDRDYCYPPDYAVLRNKLDIRDAAELETAERELVTFRLLEPMPAGNFDLTHLKAIHRHLFQDIYAWAGDVRTVESAKGKNRFQPRRFIAADMADIHCRIVATEYFRGSDADVNERVAEVFEILRKGLHHPPIAERVLCQPVAQRPIRLAPSRPAPVSALGADERIRAVMAEGVKERVICRAYGPTQIRLAWPACSTHQGQASRGSHKVNGLQRTPPQQ